MSATMLWLPNPESVTALVAGQLRAELARARMPVKRLVELAGGSYSYWSRRVNGSTPLDVQDLVRLSMLLSIDITDLVPDAVFKLRPGPNGEGTDPVGPAGLEPATYGLQVRSFTGSTVADLTAIRERAGQITPLRRAA